MTPASTYGAPTADVPLPSRVCMQLDHGEHAPGEARQRCRAELRRHGVLEEEIDTALLLLSELVTNSVQHARPGPIDVEVDVQEASIRLTVTDRGPYAELPAPHAAAAYATRGRGLVLVDAFSLAWEHGPAGGAPDHGTRVSAWIKLTL